MCTTSMGSVKEHIVKTDVVIVGAGPAGASLACFLSSHGIKGIMVDLNSTSADTPRAHITNMAALECLRDIGLDAIATKLASHGDKMQHTRWCHSMAGREYARVFSWGNDPKRKGEYIRASPCSPCDLPQTLLEPELVRYATLNGFQMRWNTDYLEHSQTPSEGVTVRLLDRLTGFHYAVQAAYLFGADGARSKIVTELGLPLDRKPGGGPALNVLVKADLSHLMKCRTGNLHYVLQPDREHPDFGWSCVVRMVKPWHEWMFIFFPYPGTSFERRVSKDECLAQVRAVIGDDTPAEILRINQWIVNETVAEKFSEGRVFCLGDAVHRHPPFNGLGSNTCIQDAFNLAWKIAYVMKNKANPKLLETYSTERQPVGASIVERANSGFRDQYRVWSALGALPQSLPERIDALNELAADTDTGRRRRAELRDAVLNTEHEFHGLGVEMNQSYDASTAVFTDANSNFVSEAELLVDQNPDPVLYHFPSTRPGRRLPHVWVNTVVPGEMVSTIDIAGKGRFTLFTGLGGAVWTSAAASVAARIGVSINAVSIGYQQQFTDIYFDWERVRGVEESGCVLVRPDRFVAWRCVKVQGDESWAEGLLSNVMTHVLALNT